MAGVLPQEVAQDTHSFFPFVGAQVLESLTSGMYDNPLMIYREYVQNSADAIDAAVVAGSMQPDAGRIAVRISGKDRSVTIEDNGCGVSPEDALHVLADIGNSAKDGHAQRGFRGIGRLGGIGYCDLLRFETRTARDERVAVVEWDGASLRDVLAANVPSFSLEEAVQRTCTAKYRAASKTEPAHFFRVTLMNVRPFHDNVLMDVKSVRHYLSQVAPVPYDAGKFSPTEKVARHLRAVNGFRTYKVVVNGQPVYRLYADEVAISASKAVTIDDVELFEFRTEGGECLARGWYAKMQLRGALPKGLGVRGIRVRQGNIQVGDERLLADCFGEPRFASWHIGEVHAVNGHLRPNARRDGFEQSRHYERFLQQAYALGRHLTRMCRRPAGQRSAARRAGRLLHELEDLLARCVLPLGDDNVHNILRRAKDIATQLEILANPNALPEGMAGRLRAALKTLNTLGTGTSTECCLDGRILRHRSRKGLLEEVSQRIRRFYSTSASADELIAYILAPYATPTAARRLKLLMRKPGRRSWAISTRR